MHQQVAEARHIQGQRNGSSKKPNAVLTGSELDKLAPLDQPGRELLRQAMN